MKNNIRGRIQKVFYENTKDNSYEACIRFEDIQNLIDKLFFLHTHTPGEYFSKIFWKIKTDKEVQVGDTISLNFKDLMCIAKDEYKVVTNDPLDSVNWEDLDKEWKVKRPFG